MGREPTPRHHSRSCPWQTSRGRAACGAAVPCEPVRSTWPAPPGTARATARTSVTVRCVPAVPSQHIPPRPPSSGAHLILCIYGIKAPTFESRCLLGGSEQPQGTGMLHGVMVLSPVYSYPPSQDLVDGSALLQGALGNDFCPHFFHIQHESVQGLLDSGLLSFLLSLWFWLRFPWWKQKRSR